jgi:polyhydroxyalkanoate synthesis regulator phasin
MKFKSYRDESRTNWGSTDEKLSLEQLNTGALLRIADATEKMASNYTRMENDLKWHKEKYHEKNKEIERLERVIAALRGHLKRAKSKIK